MAARTLHIGHVLRSPKTYLSHKSKKGSYAKAKGQYRYQVTFTYRIPQGSLKGGTGIPLKRTSEHPPG